jgi:glycosyltransferase involved in cell wall biosynthesis
MSTLSPTASGTASTGPHPSTSPPALTRHPEVEIVIPVFNEQHALAASIRTLHDHLRSEHAFTFQLTIADNASTDRTLAIAESLAGELAEVRVLHLDAKGRGRALRAAWGHSHADVLAYMDVDLSTDLAALSGLLTPLLEGRGDITIGTRLAPASRVTRSIKRELISRAYNLLLHVLLGAGFSDAQCGFKAGRREAIQTLLPAIEDEDWFFDTELLYLAQRAKLAIREVPVRWVEDPDSRVDILAAARQDMRGVMRLRRHFSGRSSAREVQPGSEASPARAVVAPFR